MRPRRTCCGAREVIAPVRGSRRPSPHHRECSCALILNIIILLILFQAFFVLSLSCKLFFSLVCHLLASLRVAKHLKGHEPPFDPFVHVPSNLGNYNLDAVH